MFPFLFILFPMASATWSTICRWSNFNELMLQHLPELFRSQFQPAELIIRNDSLVFVIDRNACRSWVLWFNEGKQYGGKKSPASWLRSCKLRLGLTICISDCNPIRQVLPHSAERRPFTDGVNLVWHSDMSVRRLSANQLFLCSAHQSAVNFSLRDSATHAGPCAGFH